MAITAVTALTAPQYTGDINDWAIKEFHFGPYIGTAGSGITLGAASYPLMVLTETSDVVAILVRQGTAGAGAAATLRFYQAPSGTALASGTAMSAAEDVQAASLAINTVGIVDLTAASHTNLPAGTVIGFVAAGTVAAIVGLEITVVLRKKAQRTTDAGNRFYTRNA